MNISNQLCAIVIMIVLALLFKWKQRINSRTEKAFRNIYLVTFTGLFFDIVSVVAITYHDLLPELLVQLVCRLYLVTLTLITFFGLVYLATDAYKKHDMFKNVVVKGAVVEVVFTVLIMVLPLSYYLSDNKRIVYSYGMAAYVTYINVFIFISVITYITLKRGSYVQSRRSHVICVWMGVWILAAAIQFFFKEMLIVSYAAVIGNMVLFMQFENPEFNIDKNTGMFNLAAFKTKTYELYDSMEPYSLMAIFLSLKSKANTKIEDENKTVYRIAMYLQSLKNVESYRVTDKVFILLYRDGIDTGKLYEKIYNDYKSMFKTVSDMKLISFENALLAGNNINLIDLFQYAYLTKNEIGSDKLIELDKEHVDEMIHGIMMEKKIDEAIENDLINVYYQPIYDSSKKRYASAEALARIIDKDGKLIPPDEFIPVAERNGSIIAIGKRIFEKVCSMINEVDINALGLDFIEVNLSVIQCVDSSLADDFISIMEKYGTRPELINLEITETASAKEKKNLLNNMNKLIDYGIQFTLDDFGTGHSNLDYIVEMPVELVKFDKDMLVAYFEEEKAKYVMGAAMHMIHGLNLEIVAEGIETEKQFEAMLAMNIKYMQGYYFSKPVATEEFISFIRENNV